MENTSIDTQLKPLEALYADQKWDQLLTQLLDLKESMPMTHFHHNLGTVYALKGNNSAARYHLEKAAYVVWPNNSTLHNLSLVKKKLGFTDEWQTLDFSDKSYFFIKSIHGEIIEVFSAAVIVLILLFYAWGLIKKLRTVCISVGISALPLIFWFFIVSNYKQAIVFSSQKIYEGPAEIFQEKASVSDGMKLIIGRRYNGWAEIKAPKKYSGWISISHIATY